VAPESDAAQVQSFLERHISASEAKTFCSLMEKFASSHGRAGAARRTAASSAGGKGKKAKKRHQKPGTKSRAKSSPAKHKKAPRRG
jgi:hypothetical protein